MPNRTAKSVVTVALQAIAEHHRKFTTLTLDNGTEFHGYEQLEKRFPITCSFATPYHSWERGSNENLNGLFRRYVPKGTSMKTLTQADCYQIANQLNSRPRKRLGFKTPNGAYFEHDSLLHLVVETTLYEELYCARGEYRESDQGAAAVSVRGSHQCGHHAREPAAAVVFLSGLRADAPVA